MKLVICDMSGIATNRGVNNVPLLSVLQSLKNYECSFCTGKGYRGGYETIRDFDFRQPFICENGSVIVSREGHVLYHDCMNAEKIDSMIRNISELPFEFLAYIDLNTHKYKFLRGSKALSESLSQPWFYSEEIYYDVDAFLDNIDKENVCRITTRGLEVDLTTGILDDFHVVVSEHEFHSICNKETDKGSGVKKLAELCEVDLKDVIIIGNDKNDIDMFRLKECFKIATGIEMPPKDLLDLGNIYVSLDNLPQYLQRLDESTLD